MPPPKSVQGYNPSKYGADNDIDDLDKMVDDILKGGTTNDLSKKNQTNTQSVLDYKVSD